MMKSTEEENMATILGEGKRSFELEHNIAVLRTLLQEFRRPIQRQAEGLPPISAESLLDAADKALALAMDAKQGLLAAENLALALARRQVQAEVIRVSILRDGLRPVAVEARLRLPLGAGTEEAKLGLAFVRFSPIGGERP